MRSVDFFSVLFRFFPLIFGKNFFAYCQRYPLEISTATGVIDHAESEYAIFFHRKHFLQNTSGVIWRIINELFFIESESMMFLLENPCIMRDGISIFLNISLIYHIVSYVHLQSPAIKTATNPTWKADTTRKKTN